MDYKELILSALEAREKAYCPYSNLYKFIYISMWNMQTGNC